MADRHLGPSAVFLYELADSLKGDYEKVENPYLEEKYSPDEQARYSCAKFQFDKRDYMHCIQTLGKVRTAIFQNFRF